MLRQCFQVMGIILACHGHVGWPTSIWCSWFVHDMFMQNGCIDNNNVCSRNYQKNIGIVMAWCLASFIFHYIPIIYAPGITPIFGLVLGWSFLAHVVGSTFGICQNFKHYQKLVGQCMLDIDNNMLCCHVLIYSNMRVIFHGACHDHCRIVPRLCNNSSMCLVGH